MSGCQNLRPYLDRQLDEDTAMLTEQHIDGCESCAAAVHEWEFVEDAVRDHPSFSSEWSPTAFDVTRIVALARERQERAGWWQGVRAQLRIDPKPLWAASSLGAAGLAAVLLVVASGELQAPSGMTLAALEQEQSGDDVTGDVAQGARGPVNGVASNVNAAVRPKAAPRDGATELAQASGSERSPARIKTGTAKTPVEVADSKFASVAVLFGAKDAVQGDKLQAPKDRRVVVRVGDDRLAMVRGTQGRVIDASPQRTRIRVGRGTMVFEVKHRQPGDVFEVEARDHLIQVVGTRFSVSVGATDSVVVRVDEGIVRVITPDKGTKMLRKGQSYRHGFTAGSTGVAATPAAALTGEIDSLMRLTDGGSTPMTAAESAAARRRREHEKKLATWRGWVASGSFETVEVTLGGYLKKSSRDADAWRILADARAGAQHWKSAIEAYGKVIRFGRGGPSNEARFDAAVILTDRLHENNRAVAMLRTYLTQKSRPREPQAMIRLAKAWRALDRVDMALELLRTVMLKYRSTPAGTEARYLLTQWSREH